MAEEMTYLVCLPVENDPTGDKGAPGSIKDKCSECSRDVWIAPTGQKYVKEKGFVVICIPCAVRKDKEAQDKGERPTNLMPPTPEQIEEVRRAIDKKYRSSDDQTP